MELLQQGMDREIPDHRATLRKVMSDDHAPTSASPNVRHASACRQHWQYSCSDKRVNQMFDMLQLVVEIGNTQCTT